MLRLHRLPDGGSITIAILPLVFFAVRYGPGWGFIKQKFIPRLLDEGFSQETVDDFMIHNPARFYAMRK